MGTPEGEIERIRSGNPIIRTNIYEPSYGPDEFVNLQIFPGLGETSPFREFSCQIAPHPGAKIDLAGKRRFSQNFTKIH
jgi:hypothetical protein